jgi:hypothetical protein
MFTWAIGLGEKEEKWIFIFLYFLFNHLMITGIKWVS